jgi:4-amino-4-deoxy-L-arabinose transferase-like glycosyltransferase
VTLTERDPSVQPRDGGARVPLRSWAAVGAAWAVAVSALAWWLTRVPVPAIRAQLTVLQFWSLEIGLVIGVVCGLRLARDLWRALDRRDVAAMATLAGAALMLTTLVAPRTHRIFYDEQIYQGIGQNLSDLRRAQMCSDGTVEHGRLQCWQGEYNKQPYAYPHVLSLAYRAFGVRPSTAFVVNALAMAATVCAVYLLTLLLFGDATAAFFAGLIIALTPQQVVWSATAAVEPTASLACVVALVAVLQAIRCGHPASLAGAGALVAYAVQFRPESLLIVGVVAVLVWRRGAGLVARPAFWWAGLLTCALLAVHVAHLFVVRHEGWGTSAARLSIGYVLANLRVNGPFHFADERFPVTFTVLAIVGLAGRGWRRERGAMLAYFVAFFGIDLLFYAGSYDYGADVRYSLLTYPPIAVLGGLGAARVVGWLAPRLPGAVGAVPAVTAALAFQFLWYAPLVRATTEEGWAARADVRFARAFATGLPPNSYVLTHNPSMFHVWGVNAGQMSLVATNPASVDYLASRYAGGVYVHWNFWCNVADRVQAGYCYTALAVAPSTVSGEARERNQRFAFHRLTLPRQQP